MAFPWSRLQIETVQEGNYEKWNHNKQNKWKNKLEMKGRKIKSRSCYKKCIKGGINLIRWRTFIYIYTVEEATRLLVEKSILDSSTSDFKVCVFNHHVTHIIENKKIK